jgi:hypothetical protein
MNSWFSARPVIKIGCILGIIVYVLAMPLWQSRAAHPSLDDAMDIVDTVDPEEVGHHLISFTLPSDSPQVNPTNYITFEFYNYTDIVAPSTIEGNYTGTPVYQVIGRTLYVTNITIPPGGTVTFNTIAAKNPDVMINLGIIIKVTDDFAGTTVINSIQITPLTVDPFVSITTTVGNPSAGLRVSGYSAPYTYVVFNNGITVFGTAYTDATGYFSRLFTGLPGGTHSISFYGIDLEERNSSTITVEVELPLYQTTIVSNQLLSPTLEADDRLLNPGDPLYATGSAYPNSTITLFTGSPLRSYATTTDANGDWSYSITDTGTYAPGDYQLYTMVQTGSSLQSLFSPTIPFTISAVSGSSTGTACGDISQGDLNCDADVNLIDFSILMYYWGINSPAADINVDGLVDLADFSIMMYFWG